MAEYIILKKSDFLKIFIRYTKDYESPFTFFIKDDERVSDFKDTKRDYLHKQVWADLQNLKRALIEG